MAIGALRVSHESEFRFYALDVGLDVATITSGSPVAWTAEGFYALDVGLGVATCTVLRSSRGPKAC